MTEENFNPISAMPDMTPTSLVGAVVPRAGKIIKILQRRKTCLF